MFCHNFTGRHRNKPDDTVSLNGYIGDTYMMTELVLPGIALEETIKIDIATVKPGAVVLRLQATDSYFLF